MNKKIVTLSISAVVLIVLASFSSVIGTTDSNTVQKSDSPLFRFQTQRSLQKNNLLNLQSNYLGKGLRSQLFQTAKSSLAATIDRTVKLLKENPTFFEQFIKSVVSNPRVIALLQKNGITVSEFKTDLNRLKADPSLFIDEIREVQPRLTTEQITSPIPLSLNTSSVLGCVITAIVLIPVALILTLIVVFFTLRILQCLNINEVMNQIFSQITQELWPSGNLI
jgi:hypothetical protein